MKRLLPVLLLLILVLPVLACEKDQPEPPLPEFTDPGPVADLTWSLDATGTLTISGKGAMPDYIYMADVGGEQNYPPWYSRRRDILRVKLEPGLTRVGAMAFSGCSALWAVSLPEGIVEIGMEAFARTALEHCPLPESLERIGAYAFHSCDLSGALILPKRVMEIGDRAFYGCRNLTEARLPAGLIKLGGELFVGCTALQTVEVETGNSVVCAEDGVLYTADRTTLLSYPAAKPGDYYAIPEGVTTIADGAFRSCTLTAIDLPGSLQTVGNEAFYAAGALRSIVLPERVSRLGGSVFFWCAALQTAVLPEGLTEVPRCLFFGCSALTDVTIPESVTVIGDAAFRNCTALAEINLPPYLVRIEDDAFESCSSLRTIKLPSMLTEIGNRAFANTALTELHFPASVCHLDGAYWVSQTLEAITVAPENPHYFADDGILYAADGTLLCYPIGKRDTIVTLPASTTAIGPYAFERCRYLQTVVLPDTVIAIGESAFADCSALVTCKLPASLPALSNLLFSNCVSLASIELPSAITEIPSMAFDGCTSLSEIVLPAGVKQIGGMAFSGCTALRTLHLPASLLKIDTGAFGSAPLETVIFAGSRQDWEAISVRQGNNNLTSATIHFLIEDDMVDSN